jgi:hypothetical protein
MKHLALTVKRIAKLPPGRHHDGGNRGLLLQVSNTGTKSWLLRYELDKKERWLGLGSYPDVPLENVVRNGVLILGARERARLARLKISGQD